MSEWKVEVVKIQPEWVQKHPNADALDIITVFGAGGYPCITKRDSISAGDLCVYVPIDSQVPIERTEFNFLRPDKKDPSRHTLEAIRLRGVFSMGLLILLPKDIQAQEGDIVHEQLNITKYEPDESNKRGNFKGGNASGPVANGECEKEDPRIPYYTDIEGIRRWSKVLQEGEAVVCSEKTHGSNARAVFLDGKLKVGSRTKMKRRPGLPTKLDWVRYYIKLTYWKFMMALNVVLPDRFFAALKWYTPKHPQWPHEIKPCVWWLAVQKEGLEEKLQKIPGIVLFGEVTPTQDLKYGTTAEEPRFWAFDMYDTEKKRYLDYHEFVKWCTVLDIRRVPVLYEGPWSDSCKEMAEGQTTVNGANHVREGFVVKPVIERTERGLGRCILKVIGEGYLLRGKNRAKV